MRRMDTAEEVSKAVQRLGGRTVLDRERAAANLVSLLKGRTSIETLDLIERASKGMLTSERWEDRMGGLVALTIAPSQIQGQAFARHSVEAAIAYLEDSEVRVRLAVGDCLGAAAMQLGPEVWLAVRDRINAVIEHSWDRDALVAGEPEPEDGDRTAGSSMDFVSNLLQSSYNQSRPGTGEMRHGTEGWQALETSFVALRKIMEACGQSFQPHLTPELRALLYKAIRHPNRFVRETSYHVLATVCTLSAGPNLKQFGGEVAECLQDGLSENWSQVRYAACVCARAFMQAAEGFREAYFPQILPHLCFNRYDVAEGVRSYSLDTWKLIMKDSGPLWVAKCIDQVVAYYVRCAKTNNHTVREAACSCLGELFVKIDRAAVEPHLPKIQRTLLRGLKDDSWTVRDAASLAYAKAALVFPEASRALLAQVWPLWFGLLDDNVFSVRENAALALCDVVRAYGQEALDVIMPVLRERLPQAQKQPIESVASPSVPRHATGMQYRDAELEPISSKVLSVPAETEQPERGAEGQPSTSGRGTADPHFPASAGSHKQGSPRQRAPDAAEHAGDEQSDLFKEGALLHAKKDTGGIDYSCGCMDYGFKRPKEPWEASDGAVYLLAGLAEVAPAEVPPLLPQLADIARLDHFAQAPSLQTTIWRQLPEILHRLGKKVFKPYIELFLEPLFRSLEGENQLCRAAAGACLGVLRDTLGPSIFAGRLDERQQAAMASSRDVPAPAGRFAAISKHMATSAQQPRPMVTGRFGASMVA